MRARMLTLVFTALLVVTVALYRYAVLTSYRRSLESVKYPVEHVAICFECHSERDYSRFGWPIAPGMAGAGRIMLGEGTTDQLVAPNITPDKDTRIGAWSDAELIDAIKNGIAPDGRRLNPEMPYRYYERFTNNDLRAVLDYLRSIPPDIIACRQTQLLSSAHNERV